MRKIQKKREPRQLTEYKKQPGANYEGFSKKDVLREGLVQEQRGLCCYCMRRIRSNDTDMKIEHCRSQSEHAGQALNYRNMLGACKGGEVNDKKNQNSDTSESNKDSPRKKYHCDTSKGSHSLSLNPADADFESKAQIQFSGDGIISSKNKVFDDELRTVLNLNLAELKAGRKAVLVAFQIRLENGKKFDAAKELPNWDGSQGTELREYAEVVAAYLRKKLR